MDIDPGDGAALVVVGLYLASVQPGQTSVQMIEWIGDMFDH